MGKKLSLPRYVNCSFYFLFNRLTWGLLYGSTGAGNRVAMAMVFILMATVCGCIAVAGKMGHI